MTYGEFLHSTLPGREDVGFIVALIGTMFTAFTVLFGIVSSISGDMTYILWSVATFVIVPIALSFLWIVATYIYWMICVRGQDY